MYMASLTRRPILGTELPIIDQNGKNENKSKQNKKNLVVLDHPVVLLYHMALQFNWYKVRFTKRAGFGPKYPALAQKLRKMNQGKIYLRALHAGILYSPISQRIGLASPTNPIVRLNLPKLSRTKACRFHWARQFCTLYAPLAQWMWSSSPRKPIFGPNG